MTWIVAALVVQFIINAIFAARMRHNAKVCRDAFDKMFDIFETFAPACSLEAVVQVVSSHHPELVEALKITHKQGAAELLRILKQTDKEKS